jgi:hypothetical protein
LCWRNTLVSYKVIWASYTSPWTPIEIFNFSSHRHWFYLKMLNRSNIFKWTNMVWLQSESYYAKNILFGINSTKWCMIVCPRTHARTHAHTSDILFPRYDHNERLFQHILPIRLVLYITLVLCVLDEEKIEYTKGVFRSRKSRKNRQQNGLKKMTITETSGTH